jgi:L-threonylcarbamoyladenylate synthase
VPTDLIEIIPENPHADAIERAAAIIRRGGVVALPTDALYTLVADPYSLKAVGKVFDAKGRQPQRSVPLLVTDTMMAEELVTEMTTRFQKLARKFWPGPLTIIVPAASRVPLRVTGNTGRLALRQSKSVVANRLLEVLGQPLVATSANISGSPTCRTGIECFAVMDRRVDLVLDGGHCVGEGSTTIDITEPFWRVIKEGSISEKEIAEVLKGQ